MLTVHAPSGCDVDARIATWTGRNWLRSQRSLPVAQRGLRCGYGAAVTAGPVRIAGLAVGRVAALMAQLVAPASARRAVVADGGHRVGTVCLRPGLVRMGNGLRYGAVVPSSVWWEPPLFERYLSGRGLHASTVESRIEPMPLRAEELERLRPIRPNGQADLPGGAMVQMQLDHAEFGGVQPDRYGSAVGGGDSDKRHAKLLRKADGDI